MASALSIVPSRTLALPSVMLNRSADTRDSVTVSDTKAMALSAVLSSPAVDGGRCAVVVADMQGPQLLEPDEPVPPPPPPPELVPAPVPSWPLVLMPVVFSAGILPSR